MDTPKRRRGRPPKAEGAMSGAERQRRYLERQRSEDELILWRGLSSLYQVDQAHQAVAAIEGDLLRITKILRSGDADLAEVSRETWAVIESVRRLHASLSPGGSTSRALREEVQKAVAEGWPHRPRNYFFWKQW